MSDTQSNDKEKTTHTTSYGELLLLWIGLVVLTGTTLALAGFELGRWVIITALGIASVKSALVMNVFMHLRFEDKVFRVFVLVAVLTFAVFITFTFFDYAFR